MRIAHALGMQARAGIDARRRARAHVSLLYRIFQRSVTVSIDQASNTNRKYTKIHKS